MRPFGRGGFTLVETLVALSVVGLAMGLLTTFVAQLRTISGQASDLAAAEGELVSVRLLLRTVFERASPGRYPALSVGGTERELTILSEGTDVMLTDRAVPVSLKTEESGLLMTWRDADGGAVLTEAIARRAKNPRLSYFVPHEDGTPGGSWNSTWLTPHQLPIAVSLTLEYEAIGAPVTLVFRTVKSAMTVCRFEPTLDVCEGTWNGR